MPQEDLIVVGAAERLFGADNPHNIIGTAQWSDVRSEPFFKRASVAGTVVVIDAMDAELQATARRASQLSELWNRCHEIIAVNVDSPAGHGVALQIAAACWGSMTVESDLIPNRSHARINRRITPAPIDSVPYPDTAGLLPPEMKIDPPPGPGNDYRWLLDGVDHLAPPKISISVVIPVFNRAEMLARTIACLMHQTYPSDLIEIVVADDGSEESPLPVLKPFKDHFASVKYVRQPDDGYQLCAIRNLGIRAAANDNIVVLDCDMAPVPGLVEAYARRLAACGDAVYLGHRRYVDANDVSVSDVIASPQAMLRLKDIATANLQVMGDEDEEVTVDWRIPIYQETEGLRFDNHPFRAVCGGNIGFNRVAVAKAGLFDEAFTAWGAEDGEWGYRAWNKGLYIVPVIEACGFHQEPPGGRNETDREAGRAITHPMLTDRVPIRYRPRNNSGGFSIPLVSIYMPAFNAADTIVSAVESALDQTVRDLEVCVVDDGSTDGTDAVLAAAFGDNPRVHWRRQANGGIGTASNSAVRMCRGAYIGQLDADDLLTPNAVEVLLREIEKDPRVGVAYGSVELMDEFGNRTGDGYEVSEFSREKMMYGMIVHPFRFFRSRDWHRTAGFAEDVRNAVDFDMFLKMSEVTEVIHVPEQVYRYRIHSASTSHQYSDEQKLNHVLAIKRALRRRGLDRSWEIRSIDPTDPRKVEFVPRADPGLAPTTVPHAIETVRLTACGPQHLSDDVSRLLKNLRPLWEFELNTDDDRFELVGPRISAARSKRQAEDLRRHLSHIDASLELMEG